MQGIKFICCLFAAALWAQEPILESELIVSSHPVLGVSLSGKQDAPASQSICYNLRSDNPSRLQVGGSYTHLRIKPQGLNNYNGNLAGVQGIYEYRPGDMVYGGALVRWRAGKEAGMNGSMNFTDWNGQIRIGYTIGRSQSLLSLFTGFGFRYLGQDLTPKTSTPVNFKYEEFYVPVGFAYDYQFASWLSWGLYGTWMPQVYPSVTLEPPGGERWILSRTFKNGLVEMPFTFSSKRFESVSFILKPFAEYWQDGHTMKPVGAASNTYLFVGVDVNMCFAF